MVVEPTAYPQKWLLAAGTLLLSRGNLNPGNAVASTCTSPTGGSARECYAEHAKNHTHRIHGAAIYGNMDPINIPQSC